MPCLVADRPRFIEPHPRRPRGSAAAADSRARPRATSRRRSLACSRLLAVAGSLIGLASHVPDAAPETVVTPRMSLADADARDQDDMCIWIHPTDRARSTLVVSDKEARKVFVYDLEGATLQALAVDGQPGNIDVRYQFPLAGGRVDLVALNNRSRSRIEAYGVDPETRLLTRIDDGAISTGPNYGICLYRSVAGSYYAFTTSEDGTIEQYVLRDHAGRVGAARVRTWSFSDITEGCVCDDLTGDAYFGEEDVGIWKVGAEPDDPVSAELIAAVGDASGLVRDVEGLALYYAAGGEGYLIASSQGNSRFKVYARHDPHAHVATIELSGVAKSDGIDVTNVSLGPAFPAGLFAAHSHVAGAPDPVAVCAYEDLGLLVDTLYWDPRRDPALDAGEPAPPALALRIEYPAGSPGRPTVACALPDSRPAALEMFDLAGRRLLRRRLDGASGSGIQRVDLAAAGALRSGIYLVRLTHPSASLAAKAVVTR
jgi:3-phytase